MSHVSCKHAVDPQIGVCCYTSFSLGNYIIFGRALKTIITTLCQCLIWDISNIVPNSWLFLSVFVCQCPCYDISDTVIGILGCMILPSMILPCDVMSVISLFGIILLVVVFPMYLVAKLLSGFYCIMLYWQTLFGPEKRHTNMHHDIKKSRKEEIKWLYTKTVMDDHCYMLWILFKCLFLHNYHQIQFLFLSKAEWAVHPLQPLH